MIYSKLRKYLVQIAKTIGWTMIRNLLYTFTLDRYLIDVDLMAIAIYLAMNSHPVMQHHIAIQKK